jgi:peptide/nickel transport system permease protein
MIPYLVKKLLSAIPVAIGLTIIAFLLGVAAPGDPAYFALANDGLTEPTPEELERMREKLGLDEPVHIQYLNWLLDAVQGDLGESFRSGLPVAEELGRRLPVTLNVSLLALVFAVLIGIPVGVAAAAFHNRGIDRAGQLFSLVLISVPGFWLGILFITLFAEILKILPTSGYGGLVHLLMPSFVLAAGTIGVTVRLTRASLLDELHKDYILTARSKGLSPFSIVTGEALQNSLIPVITLIGTYLGNIIGGSVIVEVIFALPGMGQFAINGVMNRDFPVIQGYVLITGSVFIIIHLGIDLFYLLLNPQIRLGGKQEQ